MDLGGGCVTDREEANGDGLEGGIDGGEEGGGGGGGAAGEDGA